VATIGLRQAGFRVRSPERLGKLREVGFRKVSAARNANLSCPNMVAGPKSGCSQKDVPNGEEEPEIYIAVDRRAKGTPLAG
jgi:hypothetical protein